MSTWWRGAVIYQIYPRSFCDSNGDGIGDLAGISSRLDYIANLGVDAIWISPFFKSPMKDFGYDVSDYRAVDPIFGSLDDFDKLLAKAHDLGLKVIIDQVYSHTSDQCAWFKDSRSSQTSSKADWYVWADAVDGESPPNNWESVFWGHAWTWDPGREQYYLHNFLSEQPDLNLHNPEVRQELRNIARFWLDRGVDGFRFDASNYFMHDLELRDNEKSNDPDAPPISSYNESHPDTTKFINELRTTLDSYPDTFSVAEIGGDRQRENTLEYTAGNELFDTAYNFTFLGMRELSASALRDELIFWADKQANYPSWAFSNHDMPRVLSRWGEDGDPSHFANLVQAVLVSLRGTIFLYQGEELGLPQADVPRDRLQDPEAIVNWPNIMGRDGARTPMPWRGKEHDGGWGKETWLPIDSNHYELSVEAQLSNENSTLAFCQRLLEFRKEHPALIDGDLAFIDSPDNILAFVRHSDSESMLCVFNLSRKSMDWIPDCVPAATVIDDGILVGGVDKVNPSQLPPLAGYICEIAEG